jgi:hypothetical protein
VGSRGVDTYSAIAFKNEREYVEYYSVHDGTEFESTKGTYQYADGILKLSKREEAREDTFYVVKWSGSVFLIDPSSMPAFCSNVSYFHHSLMRQNCYSVEQNPRDSQPLKGLPEVPERFRPLLKVPFTARITRIEKERYFLDKGSKYALVPNTRFRVKTKYCYPLTALKVGEETTECTAKREEPEQVKPVVGMIVRLDW